MTLGVLKGCLEVVRIGAGDIYDSIYCLGFIWLFGDSFV